MLKIFITFDSIMTVVELVDKISDWEYDAGESFTDNFMHDNVSDNSWAFWLIGKGFHEHGNTIIAEIVENMEKKKNGEMVFCLDQELLYEVYPEYVDDKYQEEAHEKNIYLWTEFLLSTPYYMVKTLEWFEGEDF